jgi:alanine-glyoxylate transaminase/serine-glyoxylate transaminase/serine-pyruvate transaminase
VPAPRPDVEIVETPWGEGIPADRFEEILRADTSHRIKAVLATHNETATGVLSDIAAVRAAHGRRAPPRASVRRRRVLHRLDAVRVRRLGRRRRRHRQPEGLHAARRPRHHRLFAKAMAATETGGLPRCFYDIRDMAKSYAANGYPYTPAVGLLNGLAMSCEMILAEGLDAVFARHARIADGVRAAVEAWGLELCAARPSSTPNSVSAIRTPEGFDATRIVTHAADTYGVAFGVGLGEVAGKVFRIGHLGMLTDVLALSGIATAEMAMADLGLDVKLGSGVAAAQEVYRSTATSMALARNEGQEMKDLTGPGHPDLGRCAGRA